MKGVTPTVTLLSQINKAAEWAEASQWWPADALRRWQLRRLGRLVAFVRARVPYYAGRMPDVRRPGSDTVDEALWQTLPLLSKAIVREHAGSLRSDHSAQDRRVSHRSSSGSTGEPLETMKELGHAVAFGGIKLRYLRSLNLDFSARFMEIRGTPPRAASPTDVLRSSWGHLADSRHQAGEVLKTSLFSEPAVQIDLITRERPAYILTSPGNLRLLLRELRRTGRRLPSLRHVQTMGEQVDPDLFAECRKVLGMPMYDVYGASEADYIACSCPEHEQQYHVHGELNYVEVLRTDGRACEPGETGRVVVTPLHDGAMPLIRYDLGDYAEVGAPCACGRGLPVLRRILGKSRGLLTLPSGGQRAGIMCDRVFGKIDAVRRVQVAQTGLKRIEVRLVLHRPLTVEERGEIERGLIEQTGPGFELQYAFPEAIGPGKNGKFMDFVSELADAAPGG